MDTNFRDEYWQRRIKILELQRRLERENAVMLYGALAKHAPAALEELRGKLHQNTNEPDKLAIQYPEVFGIATAKRPVATKDIESDCPGCASCGIELGEDVGYYSPGMKWVDASVSLYPWRGEYYCDGCLSEEFYMLRRDMEEGSVTVFFGADEMDMPDELVIIADEQEG